MFGSKKNGTSPAAEIAARIQTIPDIFYGGADPEIYRRETTSVGSDQTLHSALPKKNPSPASGQVTQTSSHTLLWIGTGILLLSTIGGISWYYIQQTNKSTTVSVVKNKPLTTTAVPVQNETPSIVSTSTPIIETVTTTPVVTTTRSLVGGPLEFPVFNLIDTADLDKDALSDAEEELFSTDPGTWDTDADGYYDGQELFNLYNPKGFAPVKLIDSGLVQEYTNPFFKYRLYYPKGWQIAPVDIEATDVLVSAQNGDYVEIRWIPKKNNEDFNTWFAREIRGERITEVRQFTNRFGVSVMKRRDDLVAYVPTDTAVAVIILHSLQSGPVSYRHVASMIAQSFRVGTTTTSLPDQKILPGVLVPNEVTINTSASATTTGQGDVSVPTSTTVQ